MSALWGRSTVVTPLVVFTLATICWSLWVRWATWHCPDEIAATLNIALQGGAVFLMSPFVSNTIGHWLYRATGCWNLEDMIGHDLYVIVASAITMDALYRLDVDIDWKFRRYVEWPATVFIPFLLLAFAAGDAVRSYHPDFFRAPVTDLWMLAYWLILCGLLAHLLVYSMRALIPLWMDRSSRMIATVYMIATGCGITACISRMTTATFLNDSQQDTVTAGLAVWIPAALCGSIFAAAAGLAWLQRVRRLISL